MATAVTKLVSEGRLSLDETLANYFPEIKDRISNSDRITLRMMIRHRSGIPNITDTPGFWLNPPKNNKESLERINDLPAEFEPGEEYMYSNTNYVLIIELLNKTLGYNYFDYIKEKILNTLGLKNTFASINSINKIQLMSGYYVGVKEDIKNINYGSMIATAEDVGKFIRALNDGSLFSEEEMKIYSSIYRFNHTGLLPGYQSIAKYHKDINTVVV